MFNTKSIQNKPILGNSAAGNVAATSSSGSSSGSINSANSATGNSITSKLVLDYVAQKSQADTGCRLSVISYRPSKDSAGKTIAAKQAVCCSVPVLVDADWMNEDVVQKLAPSIYKMLVQVQDKIVREQVEEGKLEIDASSTNIEAIVDWLQDETANGRLSKQLIADWLEENCMEGLATRMLAKMPAITDEQLAKVWNEVSGKIQMLAGVKTWFPENVREKLKVVVDLATDKQDIMYGRLVAKLDKMKELDSAGGDLLDSI